MYWGDTQLITCPLKYDCNIFDKMIFIVRPFHIPSLMKIHVWNHVNKEGYQVSTGNKSFKQV